MTQLDERLYNLPNVVEVAALIVGDKHTCNNRDIIIEKKTGLLQRISELHLAYLYKQPHVLMENIMKLFSINILYKSF